MTMGEKIVALRKRECWSQEDLADRLDVSRQSVSKWEGDLAAPALDKLLELSRLFGVSTDYLIKDEMESPEPETPALPAEPAPEPLRQMSLEEAKAFLALKEASARPTALAVALCILSPVCLILLGGLKTYTSRLSMSDGAAAGLGLTVLFAFIVPAVAIFVRWGMKLDKYEYLEKEIFTAGPGVEALARSRMEALEPVRTRRLTAGVCLCVLAVVPMFLSSFWPEPIGTLVFAVGGVGLLLALMAVGVYLIMTVSTPWDGYQMLLQIDDYAPEKKRPIYRALPPLYWCAVTAGYLAWSFATGRWNFTWIVWPPAGVLFGGLMALLSLLAKRKKR